MNRILALFQAALVLVRVSSEKQEWKYHQTAACCSEETPDDLMACLENVNQQTSDIAIISYASPDILPYASFAFAINSAYAEQNDLEIHFLSAEKGYNFEPRDARWNRVKILEEALDTENGWLNDADYLIWMDSDLIVLDMDLDFRQLISDYPDKDIIISAERHAETGVANTGCFLIKNSLWSRSFLSEWWNTYDRSKAHDQIYFDKLYKSKLPGVANHIKILPIDEINSTPPPTLYQTEGNQVLHLMGQHAYIRSQAFQTGFDEVCRMYEEKSVMEPQLGLTQPRLFNLAFSFFQTDLESRLEILSSSNPNPNHPLGAEGISNSLSICREHVLQLGLYGESESDLLQHSTRIYNIVKSRLSFEKAAAAPDPAAIVSLYHVAAVYGNDLASLLRGEEKERMLDEVGYYIEILRGYVHPDQAHIALEYLMRHYVSRGQFATFENRDTSTGIAFYDKALTTYNSIQKEYANPVHLVEVLTGLGVSYCQTFDSNNLSIGIHYFDQSLELQQQLLASEQQLKEDHLSLALTFLRQTGCLAKAGRLHQAKHSLEQVVDICTHHPQRQVASEYLSQAYKVRDAIEKDLLVTETEFGATGSNVDDRDRDRREYGNGNSNGNIEKEKPPAIASTSTSTIHSYGKGKGQRGEVVAEMESSEPAAPKKKIFRRRKKNSATTKKKEL